MTDPMDQPYWISQVDHDETGDEIQRLYRQLGQLASALADRDALIAEALALTKNWANHRLDKLAESVADILSRALLGAKYEDHACSLCGDIHEREPADRRGEAGDGPPTTNDPAPLGSDQRVAPDRGVLAKALCRIQYDDRSIDELVAPSIELWQRFLPEADALIASGVLGVSADLIRAEARWKALGEAADALAAYRDKRRSTLSISHATDALRVVSALHAEASAEHLRLAMEVADHG